MKYTNKYRLPQSIVDAIIKVQAEYDNEGSDLSASSITVPPRIYWYNKRYEDEIVVDVRSLFRSFVGTVCHSAAEAAALEQKHIFAEVRYAKEILGWKVSAKIDRYDKKTKTLTDLKFSSIYSLSNEAKFDYVAQLNTQAYLMNEVGIEVKKLQLDMSAIDWYEGRSIQKDYPNSPSKSIPVEFWPYDKTEQFLIDRVKLLQSYEHTPDDEIPICSPEERWCDPTVWAVYKDNKAKRALKLHSSEIGAVEHSAKIGGRIERREGIDKRCVDYCNVNFKCSYALGKGYV